MCKQIIWLLVRQNCNKNIISHCVHISVTHDMALKTPLQKIFDIRAYRNAEKNNTFQSEVFVFTCFYIIHRGSFFFPEPDIKIENIGFYNDNGRMINSTSMSLY